ncbi:MAG: Rieske 2Fe-2S domain-containing protein, partial [Gammaproteobacteria bacterium]|nr:Rieske 2Fe-2S domain-containing protein [Gammaproteobacteria bacterium]
MARLEFDGLDLERAPDPARIEAFLRAMSDFWQPAAWSRDLAERALRGVRVLGKDLVLARLDGTVVALRDACRHFQARLSLGEV